MPVLVRLEDLRTALAEDPDRLAEELLPEGSFARAKYEQGIVYLDRPHRPEDADREELERWGLTPEQWSEQMELALVALRHDLKLDAIREGIGRV